MRTCRFCLELVEMVVRDPGEDATYCPLCGGKETRTEPWVPPLKETQ